MVRISPSPTPHRTLWGFGFDPLGSLIFEFQLFYSLFKSLHGKEMLIELKNDLRIRCCAITQRDDSSLSSFFQTKHIFLLISAWCRGKLHSVDQYLNFKLTGYVALQRHQCLRLTPKIDIRVENEEKYPHLLSVTSIFIRGSVVRYFFCCFCCKFSGIW